MISHGMTLLALNSTPDERWENALAALLAVHPIRAGEGEDDYIAVMLDAKFCHMELCAGAQDKGLQFSNGYADDEEDVINAYQAVEAAMEQVNKERLQLASKPNKRARTKKSNAAGRTLEIADETATMGESSRPKRKSTSGGGEREASRAKNSDGKLFLAAAILQANNLTSKTKPSEVVAMYKSLEEGLGQSFPYGQDPLPCKIPAQRIHLAPDSLKYRVYVERLMEVFDAWEQGKLIGEDGKKPDGCISKIPNREITANDVDRTVGLCDSEMLMLVDAILAKEVSIKSNKIFGEQQREGISLPEWCRLRKRMRLIMNELMEEFRNKELPSKKKEYVEYFDMEWEDLAREKNPTD